MSRDSWASSFGFLMSTAGAAIGLGSIWRFPYICAQNGGAAFVLLELLLIALIGLPVLISEFAIGRKSRLGGAGAFSSLLKENKAIAYGLGLLCIITGLVLTSYYTVISGWSLEYLYISITGALSKLSATNSEAYFQALIDSPERQIFWHLIFSLASIWVLWGGISGGIEKFTKIAMPVLFLLLLSLAIYSLWLEAQSGKGLQSLRFLFVPDWSKLSWASVSIALGQSMYVLSIAIGTMVAYGSYLNSKENIAKLSLIIAVMSVSVGLISAVIVFSIAFVNGLEVNAGTGLVFITLPALFSTMPPIIAIAFYVLLFFAAITSSISLLEPSISYLVDEFKFTRRYACVLAGALSIVLGLVWIWTDSLEKNTNLENIDMFISNIMIPLGSIGIAIYAGWFLSVYISRKEMQGLAPWLFRIYLFLCRWVLPLVVIVFALVSVWGNS